MTAFLLIDVDGYGGARADQRCIVAPGRDGYRPRELGWAYFGPGGEHDAGSVFFYDAVGVEPLRPDDPSVAIVRGLHGLPVAPRREDYGALTAFRSDALREVLRTLRDAVAAACGGARVAFVHKGGNEGVWVAEAAPGAPVIELGTLGCPRVDEIGRARPDWTAWGACSLHGGDAPRRARRRRGIVHCPLLEVRLLALWLAEAELVHAGGAAEKAAP